MTIRAARRARGTKRSPRRGLRITGMTRRKVTFGAFEGVTEDSGKSETSGDFCIVGVVLCYRNNVVCTIVDSVCLVIDVLYSSGLILKRFNKIGNQATMQVTRVFSKCNSPL